MGSLESTLQDIVQRLRRIESGMDKPEPAVLSPRSAAAALSIGLTTLKSMVRNNEILTVKVHGRWMVPMDEIVRISTPMERPQAVRRSAVGRARTKEMAANVMAAIRKRSL